MKKEIRISKNYILIPIYQESENKVLSFSADGNKVFEFNIPVNPDIKGSYLFHYMAPVPVMKYKGHTIIIEGDVPESFLRAIAVSDTTLQVSASRPFIHFSANTGWLNDPNGLVYKDGIYHLYFQYNPFDTRWENMCWGHATSKDLLRWTQNETVLYPDGDGTMFSGCCVINEKRLLGLPAETLVFFYTCAGGKSKWSKDKPFTQKIAYSTNDGYSLHKREGIVIENIADGNRDPKVYWHEASGAYYMILYLKDNDFAIFRSEDLENWKRTQTITLDEAWECPDLREIPIEGGGSKWVLWSASGHYFPGDFNGYIFTKHGTKGEAYKTNLPYAAQTYFGSSSVITIPWFRTSNRNKPYKGVMGLPRKLSLKEADGSFFLRQLPVDEFEACKKKIFEAGICGEPVTYTQKKDAPVEILLKTEDNCSFHVNIYGTNIDYNSVAGWAVKVNATFDRVNTTE